MESRWTMKFLAAAVLALSFCGCSGALGPDDLKSSGMEGIVLKKTESGGDFFLHVRLPSGDQETYKVTGEAYRLVGEGDSLPVSESLTSGGPEEIDEESAREGDSRAFTKENEEPGGD